MSKRKICVVVTARPTYARVKSALAAILAHPDLELQLVAAASALLERYGRVIDVMRRDGFTIAAEAQMVLEDSRPLTQAKTTGLGMIELASVFERLRPDIVVTVADRYETLATAAAASYGNIPLAHLQGGEITGSIDEKVRHAITKLADLHFTSTQAAAERVIRMGERADRVWWTGCPSIDLAVPVHEAPALDFDPIAAYGGVGAPLDLSQGYLVCLQHPVTTEADAAGSQIAETVAAVQAVGLPVLWFWPNVDAGSDEAAKVLRRAREEGTENIHWFRNMEPDHFLRLIVNSRCLIGNSSVAIREGAFLGVPAVNIGTRQQNRERGPNVIDVPPARAAIADAIRAQCRHGRYESDATYGDGQAGARIADLLADAPLEIEKQLTYG